MSNERLLLAVCLLLQLTSISLLVYFAFWAKKKFQEAGDLFLAAKTALSATQCERDLTRSDTSRALRHVTDRMDEMRNVAAKIETVAAIQPSYPTVPVPVPVVVVEPPTWKPGDPERRHE